MFGSFYYCKLWHKNFKLHWNWISAASISYWPPWLTTACISSGNTVSVDPQRGGWIFFPLRSLFLDSGWFLDHLLESFMVLTIRSVVGDVNKCLVCLFVCFEPEPHLTHHLFWEQTETGTPQTGSHSSTPEWRRSWSTAQWWRCWCLQTPPEPGTNSRQQRRPWWEHIRSVK